MSPDEDPPAPASGTRFAAHRPVIDGDPLDAYRVQERPPHPDRPWVLSNFVAGIDGAISVDGRVNGLSSPTDQTVFDLLRSLADVVLVGAGTFRAERYPPIRLPEQLRAEREARGQAPVPRLAVVSRSLQLDWERPSFTKAESRPVVITSEASDAGTRDRASEVADVVTCGEDRVEVPAALEALFARGDRVVLCEGGAALMAELIVDGLLDELCLTVAPLVGGDPSRIVADEPRGPLTRFELAQVVTAGDELYLRYLLRGDGTGDASDG
jgi:riboflavin biosynthesis pyrimidine reductase